MNKFCTVCNIEKSLEDFNKQATGSYGVRSYCRVCQGLESKTYYLENDERIRSRTNKYKKDNRNKVKNRELQRLYGITLEEYNRLFIEQNGSCSICKRHQTQFKNSLHVDHNHITKEIRGLLCGACNHALGLLKVDSKSDIVDTLNAYLNKEKTGAKQRT